MGCPHVSRVEQIDRSSGEIHGMRRKPGWKLARRNPMGLASKGEQCNASFVVCLIIWWIDCLGTILINSYHEQPLNPFLTNGIQLMIMEGGDICQMKLFSASSVCSCLLKTNDTWVIQHEVEYIPKVFTVSLPNQETKVLLCRTSIKIPRASAMLILYILKKIIFHINFIQRRREEERTQENTKQFSLYSSEN